MSRSARKAEDMINQLVFIMSDNDGIGRLIAYLEYRFNGAMWYPIPPGEWDLWGGSGPETELGTTLRLLKDSSYDAVVVARWLRDLSDIYNLDNYIDAEDVKAYRRSLKE